MRERRSCNLPAEALDAPARRRRLLETAFAGNRPEVPVTALPAPAEALLEGWGRSGGPPPDLAAIAASLRGNGDRADLPATFARAVLAAALADVGLEATRAGHDAVFAALRPWIDHDPDPAELGASAKQLGLSASRLVAALRRLRRRFRQRIDATLGLWAPTPEQRRVLRRQLHEALAREDMR